MNDTREEISFRLMLLLFGVLTVLLTIICIGIHVMPLPGFVKMGLTGILIAVDGIIGIGMWIYMLVNQDKLNG